MPQEESRATTAASTAGFGTSADGNDYG